ncbi:MAG: helix-hairpin-helix domain-containing protein [Defluviitaleaceae bacterium]|nr:helix-hairpin-helix domain-containing protein [Defluviitaleaceae bacterium]
MLIFTASVSAVSTNTFSRVSAGRAQVINVIDGDSMRVRMLDTGDIALVRLLCVDATGHDGAFDYLVSRLTGKTVFIETDAVVNHYTDRWNLVYMFYNGQHVNADMLANGFAIINESHREAWRYRDLSRIQNTARLSEIGRWAPDRPEDMQPYSGVGLNINTASATQLSNILIGVDAATARNIVRFRERNPFRSIGDIKFVQGFTKRMFDDNRRFMTVSTNINLATREELSTLTDVTAAMVNRLINHRSNNRFTRISTLYTEDIIPRDVFNRNEPFISTTTRTTIEHAIPNTIININTATRPQLTGIGFTARQADALIEHRERYGYKTIEELQFVPGVLLSRERIDELYDNLTVRTDINNAPHTEIRSLLGTTGTAAIAGNIERGRRFRTLEALRNHVSQSVYNTFLPFVYIDSADAIPERANLNTATRAQLRGAGLSASQATAIENARPIAHPGQIPVNIFANDSRVALYTNINAASYEELRSLGLPDDIIDAIIAYRRVQPFASQSELRIFFTDELLAWSTYNRIRDFVVFR